ncbi:MAG: ATP-binding protein, partial [Sediminibacterium sp.]
FKRALRHFPFTKLPRILAKIVLLIAALVLTGWIFHITILKSIIPDLVLMNPTSALLFAVCGVALWLRQSENTRRNSRIVETASCLVAVIASIRLLGYVPSLDIGIDQLLFPDQLNGNRMAPNTSANFLFVGVSIFFLGRYQKKGFLVSQLFALTALSIALLAVIGSLYTDQRLFRITKYVPMALHTAISFLLLTIGLLFADSRHAMMSVLTDKNIGGRMARTLLPVTLLVPVLFGWACLQMQYHGLFTIEFGTALLTVSIMVVFAVIIWGMAWSINRTDEKRKDAEIAMSIAKLDAEDAKKIQEQFLANMSHEIRTPINGVMGMVQLMESTELTGEQKEFMGMINQSASHLLVIVNDILDLTKIKAGKITIENIQYSLRDTVGSLIKIFSIAATQRKIGMNCTISPEIPGSLLGDPVRLTQILSNLINNALKFTSKGEVNLSVTVLEDNEETVTLRFIVQDTGIGIPEDKLEAIFESFTQASTDTTRKYGGTGLGLTITRQLIELQGGRIRVASKPGQGSSFTFYLPFQKSPKRPEAIIAPVNIPAGMDQLRILLADDNLFNQKIASKLLEKQGAIVDIVSNGNEVLDRLSEKRYDVVLMDINMPEMDGFEATETIRKHKSAYQSIPIIAVSASALESEKIKCMEMGMSGFLSKPFMSEELFAKIKEHLV